ncbi:hypothetical protein ACLIKE_09795 [Ferroplasma acidiphilum]|uniref:Uncharacterized protein n=1 Tax=Ferroplasma acidiphilum TaxID=74969 RepID=A0A7K4FPF6_9ARCH|nr:hypothetical protein [Ferroplasma acidiphilum]NOL60906.1 hypothetical protein [Ferroplasma acidiphilum]
MVAYDLNIESASIIGEWDSTNNHYDYNLDFHFSIEKWISPDRALEMGTKAVSDFSDWIVEKEPDYDEEIYVNYCKRGLVKMGRFANPLLLSEWLPEQNKVVPYKKTGFKSNSRVANPYITVYGIDGTPFKGMIFCIPGKRGDISGPFNYLGTHKFIFTDKLDRMIGTMEIDIASPGIDVELNYETQKARYGDFKATPQNIFKVSMSPLIDGSKQEEREFSILPPRTERSKAVTIKTSSYETLYDKDRYDMQIDIPRAFVQKNDVRIEAHNAFAEQVGKFMRNDIKWRLDGVADSFSIEYAPIESIDEVFDLAKSIASSANDVIK